MHRATLMSALALSALASSLVAPAEAAAEDCMCLLMQELARSSRMEGSPSWRIESVEVGPFFSSDGTMLSSAELERALERHQQRPTREVLWCWSPNDPRCSPSSPTPSDSPQVPSAGLSAVPVEREPDWPQPIPTITPRHASPLLGAREGVSSRVERPPRA